MTVRDLIRQLTELDPDLRVFTQGYESGYDDPRISEEKSIALNVHSDWYYGKHEDATKDILESPNKYKVVRGVVLL